MPTPSILAIFKDEHNQESRLLEAAIVSSGRAAAKRTASSASVNEVQSLHAQFEEEHLYASLETNKSTKNGTLEAYEVHAQVKYLLNNIADTDPNDERWKAKVTVLLEDIRHHVKEEGQNRGLFDELKAMVSSMSTSRRSDGLGPRSSTVGL